MGSRVGPTWVFGCNCFALGPGAAGETPGIYCIFQPMWKIAAALAEDGAARSYKKNERKKDTIGTSECISLFCSMEHLQICPNSIYG